MLQRLSALAVAVWLGAGATAFLTPSPVFAQRVTRGALTLENIPEIPAELATRSQRYQNTRAASLASWDPSGDGLLLLTRFGNTNQVHRVRQPGGARTQLTFFDEPVASASYAPVRPVPGQPPAAPTGFLFSRDVGGGEFYQYYWQDLATGEATLLTDGKSRNGGARWSRAGDQFVYTSTRRNGRDNDLYLASLAQPAAARLVAELEGLWAPLDWSPDGTRVLLLHYVSITDSSLHVLDLASGQRTPLLPRASTAPAVAYGTGAFSHDGRGVFFVSDEDSEFARLRHLDLASGRVEVLTADIAWDVGEIELGAGGRTLAFIVNAGGRSELHFLDTDTRRRTAVTGLPLGVVSGLRASPDGRRLGFTLNTPRTPGDVYSVALTGEATVQRWTESEVGGLDPARFVDPVLVDFPTFDAVDGQSRRIPAFYYKPKNAAVGAPAPVLINIHGGPEAQSLATFNPLVQFLVGEMGFAVLLPNVRGSAGYGKTYVSLDNGFRREDSVRDIGALLDWLDQQPDLDARRTAVYGGSYGGYMVLAAMTHYNDRLAAGVDVVGISNFVTFLEATQEYRRDLRRVEYGDERDPEMRAHLERISPLTNVTKITKPMLIAQGANDPRVPLGEAEQIVAALKQNGAAPWYFLAGDEGHGFAKKNNRDAFQNSMLLFLQREVAGKAEK